MILIGVGIVLVLVALLLPSKVKIPFQTAAAAATATGKGMFAVLAGKLAHLGASVKSTLREVRTTLKVSWMVYPALFLQSFVIGLLSPVITLYVQNELRISPNMYSLLLIAGEELRCWP
ncbi:hypothetical protein VQ056_19235 [Paenibacillus sp. JTLBN-2024]